MVQSYNLPDLQLFPWTLGLLGVLSLERCHQADLSLQGTLRDQASQALRSLLSNQETPSSPEARVCPRSLVTKRTSLSLQSLWSRRTPQPRSSLGSLSALVFKVLLTDVTCVR